MLSSVGEEDIQNMAINESQAMPASPPARAPSPLTTSLAQVVAASPLGVEAEEAAAAAGGGRFEEAATAGGLLSLQLEESAAAAKIAASESSRPSMDESGETSTVVIKVGTSSLINEELGSLNLGALGQLCELVARLRRAKHRVVLVSSGAVGVGCQRLGLAKKPTDLTVKQALAAVGQPHLMRYYDDFFAALGQRCAQVLLTLDNMANRAQYLNARNTFNELFKLDVVPIVNENDTVALQELRFGDNDTLSAQVANLIAADYLFLLTDVDALYTANPKTDPDAKAIRIVENLEDLDVDTSTSGTQWGTGGMFTKLTAARIASAAGCTTCVCSSADIMVVERVLDGANEGTLFLPQVDGLGKRNRWILFAGGSSKSSIVVKEDAARMMYSRRASLYAACILEVRGANFPANEVVKVVDEYDVEVARCVVNYSSDELKKLAGKRTREYVATLGYWGPDEIAHKENIVFLARIGKSTSSESINYGSSDSLMTPSASMGNLTSLAEEPESTETEDDNRKQAVRQTRVENQRVRLRAAHEQLKAHALAGMASSL